MGLILSRELIQTSFCFSFLDAGFEAKVYFTGTGDTGSYWLHLHMQNCINLVELIRNRSDWYPIQHTCCDLRVPEGQFSSSVHQRTVKLYSDG